MTLPLRADGIKLWASCWRAGGSSHWPLWQEALAASGGDHLVAVGCCLSGRCSQEAKAADCKSATVGSTPTSTFYLYAAGNLGISRGFQGRTRFALDVSIRTVHCTLAHANAFPRVRFRQDRIGSLVPVVSGSLHGQYCHVDGIGGAAIRAAGRGDRLRSGCL